MTAANPPSPLAGMVALDLTQIMAGPGNSTNFPTSVDTIIFILYPLFADISIYLLHQ